jgi:hypothetical protein
VVLLVPSSTPPAQKNDPFSTEQRTIIVVRAVQATTGWLALAALAAASLSLSL